MSAYISLIRGINVSGQKKIKMDELRKLYEDLNFKNVRSYIQSGNILFDDKSKNQNELAKKIEKKISEHFGYDVSLFVLTPDELKDIRNKNPFVNRKDVDLSRLYVTVLLDKPDNNLTKKINSADYHPDEFIITDKTIYLYCPVSYGNSKLSNNFFENKLKVIATTRNWNTVNELIKMANESSK
jgi:uncharacterized protein (DUF1697 family)